MRKIVAVFLILAMVVVFVSCGKGSDDETTTSLLTGATISTQVPVTTSSTTQPAGTNANVTYILTTSPDKTVPFGSTTKFSVTQAPTTQQGGLVINITTGPVTTPSVNYGTAPSTTANPNTTRYEGTNSAGITTLTPNTTTTSWVTTTKATTTTTQPTTKRTAVSVGINSSGYNSNTGTIIIEIDGSRWVSAPASNSVNLPIYIDGTSAGETVRCSLSSKSVGGAYEISVDVSDLNLTSGTFSIEFPEGFIENSMGQYSNSFEASGEIG